MPIFNNKRIIKINGTILFTTLLCLTPLLILILAGKPKTTSAAAGEYVTLITEERMSDTVVVEKLNNAGIKNILSESTQWFFMNDFSELRRVPLNQFHDFMMETDPRNDGYAQKLRTLFVEDGSRYFYIPRSSIRFLNTAMIEDRIKDALDGTPYRAVIFNSYTVESTGAFFIFAAASILCLIIAFFASKSSRRGDNALLPQTAALIPACALFAARGPAGFALVSILLSIFFISRKQLESLFIKLYLSRKTVFSNSSINNVKQHIYNGKKTLILATALFIAVSVIGNVNIFYALSAAALFCLIAASLIRLDAVPRGGAEHIRFIPVIIKGQSGINRRLPLIALPFTFAAAAVLAVPLSSQPLILDTNRKLPEISANDYEEHVNFQKKFALRKLTNTGEIVPVIETGNTAPYLDFEIGPDGLLRPVDDEIPRTLGARLAVPEIPPFPLEKLILSFNTEQSFAPAIFDIRELIAIIIALTVYFPAVAPRGNGKKEKNTLYISQRMTA
ncbi:MAG: hypothetical protein LBC27_04005 [Spirochaetaceae bacterium]|jgi:hypothetical protein|nr:hypothetical protein [Spirochaetaceae bacterium]